MTYISTFNADLSRRALNEIDAHPEQWNQRLDHCGSASCWAGWCDKLLGNHKEGEKLVSQKTIGSIGLNKWNYNEFTDYRNSRARLEALHLLFSTGVFGVDGRDSEGFDRDGRDSEGWGRKEGGRFDD